VNNQGWRTADAATVPLSGGAPAPPGSDDPPPTVRPPFDPQAFARESESKIAVLESGVTEAAPASTRPTTPPPAGMPLLYAIDGDSIPSLAIAREDLDWFELPKLARHLLRHVDGEAPLAVICARIGLKVPQALRLLEGLSRDGALVWH
jgi:hypothetical protein